MPFVRVPEYETIGFKCPICGAEKDIHRHVVAKAKHSRLHAKLLKIFEEEWQKEYTRYIKWLKKELQEGKIDKKTFKETASSYNPRYKAWKKAIERYELEQAELASGRDYVDEFLEG